MNQEIESKILEHLAYQSKIAKANYDLLEKQVSAFRSIASSLSRMAPEPNYRYPLSYYKEFNWSSIDAIVIKSDRSGPTIVSCNNYLYKRRHPENKYGEAIFFSRSTGKDSYERLITFSNGQSSPVEPIN